MAIPADLLEKVRNLDPLPITIQKLYRESDRERLSMADMATIIGLDQAVTANILRAANSALFGGMNPITNVQQALGRLGMNRILNLVIGDHLRNLYVDAPQYDLTENDLWLHGAVASLAVEELIAESPSCTIPDDAATAAVLHDIGKLIISRYTKVTADQLRRKCDDEEISFVEAERRVLGFDHAEVGAAVARKWSFSETLIDAIQQHHQPHPENASPTLDGVILGNLVAKTLGAGLGAEGMNFELDPGCARRQGITFARFCRVCARTVDRLEAVKSLYGIGGNLRGRAA
jgi:putative nucleotidyltransferase with HDIG domain